MKSNRYIYKIGLLSLVIISLFIIYLINTYYSSTRLIITANTNGKYISGIACINNTNECVSISLIPSNYYEDNTIILPDKQIKHLYWIPLKQKHILSIKSARLEKYTNKEILNLDKFSETVLENTGLTIDRINGAYKLKAYKQPGLLFENLKNIDIPNQWYYLKLLLIYLIIITVLYISSKILTTIFIKRYTYYHIIHLVISIIIPLTIFEIYLRYYDKRYENIIAVKFVEHYERLFQLNEKTSFKYMHPDKKTYHTVKINNLGGRQSRNFSSNKDGKIRIGIFGDSFVANYGMENQYSLTEPLDYMLNLVSNNKYEVINFGVNGYGTDQEYLHYLEFANLELDIVIVLLYGNDIKNIYKNSLFDINNKKELIFKVLLN